MEECGGRGTNGWMDGYGRAQPRFTEIAWRTNTEPQTEDNDPAYASEDNVVMHLTSPETHCGANTSPSATWRSPAQAAAARAHRVLLLSVLLLTPGPLRVTHGITHFPPPLPLP